MSSSVSATEVARFDRLARSWWDRRGPMRVLHDMNPWRVAWIAARLPAARLPIARLPAAPPRTGTGTGTGTETGQHGLRLLDVGCGGGLAAEALARLGLAVTGIDAATEAIAVARAHAAGAGLDITYRVATAEALLAEDARFDAVTALEVIEHVADPAGFLRTLAGLLRPGGRLFVSTLNRTSRSFATAIVGAEYVARLLPVGTHDWRRFVTPAELSARLRDAGMRVDDIAGMAPDLLRGGWRGVRDLGVNYIVSAER